MPPNSSKITPTEVETGIKPRSVQSRRSSLADEIPPSTRKKSIADDFGRNIRPPMNQVEFDEKFSYQKPEQEDPFVHHAKKYFQRYTHPFTSFSAFKYNLLSFLPITNWLPTYNCKENLVNDVIGGLTVGIMHVPQGIAYAVLAKVPPVNGLYTSLFPTLLYMIFGMSRHNSIGSFAVVSLMTGMAVDRITHVTEIQDGFLNLNETINLQGYTPSEVAASITLSVGLMQFLMGFLGLDFIITYFSDQVVAGFTTGASCHVLVSQIKDLLGIRKLRNRQGPGYIVMRLYDLFIDRFSDINLFSISISLIMMTILIVGKEFVNPKLNKRFNINIPIPFELFVLVGGTLTSYLMDFNGSHNMKIASKIPTGLPNASFPDFRLIPYVIPEAFSIAIVSMAVHISLAKMFAKKQEYEVLAGQELYAIGLTSIGSSAFPCYPVACSLGRTLVNVAAGTKTQLSSIFSSLLVLSVMLYFARFLETLPMCALSAIVVVALKGILDKFADLRLLWPLSKIDFSIWVISFMATTFIDVTEGLIIAIGYALFTTIMREQWPRWHLLGNVEGTADFRDSERYENVYFFNGICIFRFDSPLLFTNVENFKASVQKAFSAWQESHEYYILKHERANMLMSLGDPDR
ncbi:unnamed protein product, partial [Mesorhabditis belari]|uniref:SLC26A/SulP transporter domain-containing protein n=1 Tax=Mesorhabditis belari TaxID=2138241 RepID=A0AAF3J6J4_9BILA